MSLILKQEAANTVPTPAAGKGTIFLNDNDQVAVKTSGGNTSVFPSVTTSNTQVFYNDQGSLAGSDAFVFNDTSNTVTVANLTVTDTLIAGDIAVSSIANGTSNVDIVGVSGNVTISVAGNANILTATGTGVNVAGTLNSTGNANVGNLGTAGLITATGNVSGGNITTGGQVVATGNGSFGNVTATTFTGALSGAATTAGTVTTNAQPNITSTGTLTSLDVTGNVTAGNLVTSGSGGNISGANYVIANYFQGNGASLSSLTGANVTGQVANALVADTVYTAAQPNITSVGTLTSLGVSGNITAANITANTGIFSGNGAGLTNLAGANVTGAVSYATTANSVAGANVSGEVAYAATANAVAGANVSGAVSYATTANAVAGANVSGQVGNALVAGTVYTSAQPNITSVGTLVSLDVTGNASSNNLSTTNKVTAGNGLQVTTGALTILSGNLDVTGNLNVTGNVNYSNVTDLVVGDPLIYIGEDNPGDSVDLGIVASYNNGTYVHTGIARNAATDYWTFFDGVVAEPTTVIDWANATYPTVKMGALLSTSTVTGTQLISNIATGTAPLMVSSTTQVANLNAATAGLATYATTANSVAGANVSGAVSYATTANSVAGANVSGAVGLATYATTANAVAGANVSGQVSYAATANSVAGANVSGAVSYATTANSVAGANVSGTVATANNSSYLGGVAAASYPYNGSQNSGDWQFASSTNGNTSYTYSSIELRESNFGSTSGYTAPRLGFHWGGVVASQIGLESTGRIAILNNPGNGYEAFVAGTTTLSSLQTTTITTGANSTAGTITGTWSLSTGSKMQATYADLAEKYVADADYEPGTVLVFGGEHEVTISSELNTTRVAGVVTTNSAYSMNSALEAEHVAEIALQGRVPVKVIGPVFKGDLLVSAGNGHAIANNEARAGTIIGKSLENFTEATGVIEVAVGRF